MQVAKRVETELGESGEFDGEQFVSVTIAHSKTVRPDSRRTPAELRKLRDLFWLMLSTNFDLNPVEIEMVCSLANRKRWLISQRIKKAKAYYAKRRAERDGRL